ncbi:conjugal transfer protein TraD [Ciceribacter thiooxidans]|uniref:Conjugal transfer protein TraD n=1 Tax=Ciceribacter thiooxidans TaxID=1969821 RepID=A0ABV7IAJ2_9HYPH|nr:conjugal transfer protein TraD [Ciceribacter thiooxidans]
MTLDRTTAARERVLLGSLVVKAGLARADRAFLLGGLIELARLGPDSPEHHRLRRAGQEAFQADPSAASSPIGEATE